MLLMWLMACIQASAPAPRCDTTQPHLLVATTDYAVGALAAYVPSEDCTDGQLSALGADVVLAASVDLVWALQRTGGDTLRAYEPGAYSAPVLEVVPAPQGNAHDLVELEGQLFLTLYDEDYLLVLDPQTGATRGTIDLSPWADPDGLPEADQLLAVGGHLFVALQRLDRADGYAANTEGLVLEIDPTSHEVLGSWSVGPNPKLYSHPSDPLAMVVLTGVFFKTDGAALVLRVGQPEVEVVTTEAERGVDFTTSAGSEAGAVLLAVDVQVGGPSRIDCWAPDAGEITPGERALDWFVDAEASPEGVWVGRRTGWSGEGSAGLLRVAPGACAVELMSEALVLEPYSLLWVTP